MLDGQRLRVLSGSKIRSMLLAERREDLLLDKIEGMVETFETQTPSAFHPGRWTPCRYCPADRPPQGAGQGLAYGPMPARRALLTDNQCTHE